MRTLKKPIACCNQCGRRWAPRTTNHKTGSIIFKLMTPEESIRNHWISLGFADVPTVPDSLLSPKAEIDSDASVLHIGRLTPMILFFDRGGEYHAVASDENATALGPVLKKTVLHKLNWERPFRTLFKAIVLADDIPEFWQDKIGSSLAARGGVFLFGKAQKYAKELNDQLGLMNLSYFPKTPYAYTVLTPEPEPLGEGPGTELTESIKVMDMPQCQLCYDLAKRMNQWGIAGCRSRIDAIVTEMLPRAWEWWENTSFREKTSSWWRSSRSTLDSLSQSYYFAKSKKALNQAESKIQLEAMLKLSVKSQVVAAIDRYEAKTKSK